MSERPDWSPYVTRTNHHAPRAVHTAAVTAFDAPGRALDLGFGAGNETMDLLDRGWRVTAMDVTGEAVDNLRERAAGREGLTVVQGDLAEVELPEADYVLAVFSLFFFEQDRFPALWDRVRAAVAPGGRIAGHLLGERDSWRERDWINTHTEDAARALLDGFEVEHFEVTDEDGDAMSGPKHWHLYEFIARRP